MSYTQLYMGLLKFLRQQQRRISKLEEKQYHEALGHCPPKCCKRNPDKKKVSKDPGKFELGSGNSDSEVVMNTDIQYSFA